MAVCEPPATVLRSVLAGGTDRHPLPAPRPAGDAMDVIPAPRTPVGVPSDADRRRACERLSQVLGREVSGGWAVEQLAAEYALCFAAGFDAADAIATARHRRTGVTA